MPSPPVADEVCDLLTEVLGLVIEFLGRLIEDDLLEVVGGCDLNEVIEAVMLPRRIEDI